MPQEQQTPNRQTILTHLQHITRRWSELDYTPLLEINFLKGWENTPAPDTYYFRYPDQIKDAADHVAAMNPNKLNAYAMPNPVPEEDRPPRNRRARKDIIRTAFFQWAEADTQEGADNIRSFVGPKPTFNVITGTQPTVRPHVYWELDEPTKDIEAWSQRQRAIAATLNTDRSVVDASRMMRIAGTVNWGKPDKHAKGYVAEVTSMAIHPADARPPVTLDAMDRAFKATGTSTAVDWIDGEYGPALNSHETINSALNGDNWNEHVNKLVWRYAGLGLTDEEILMSAASLTLPGFTVDQTRQEMTTMLRYARDAGKQPKTDTFNFALQVAQPDRPKPQLEWFDDVQIGTASNYLIKGFLDQETVSVVYGPSNSGKTFFVLDMAYHLAAGIEWRGRKVRQCAVLYLAAEGGRGIINRIVALREHTGTSGLPFAVRRGGLDLLKNENDLKSIIGFTKELNEREPELPLVIVVDTLSRVMAGGDENGPVDMTQFVANMDALRAITGAHICIVHHSGKDTARGARGHSSLRAAVDTEIEIAPPGDGDNIREATDSKQREHESDRRFPFVLQTVDLGLDEEGDSIVTCVVEHVDESATPKKKKPLSKNQKKLVECFTQMVGEGLGRPNPGGAAMPEPGKFWTIPADDLREIFYGKIAVANKRDAFLTALDGLTGPEGPFCMASGLIWHTEMKVSRRDD